MTVIPDSCPACGEPIEGYAHWDWHRKVDHLRDDQPCEKCGQWDDEPTTYGEFGWMHEGCRTQVGRDLAEAHIEREDGAA